ncbi:DUF1643 domain-containing protein [Caulobacter sp. Root343]|uniref:DUF1643 domain-containing protein n=1 Tax=Caulobacter sp. Root343 TaxID=1736520 RepID=UPI0006F33352|nr:DUF1643 domain-containing protein [Caulobacter sp. Root343]KQV66588.1 hypothetical protein ASC70_12200 [Caulobacter sp. Root343]
MSDLLTETGALFSDCGTWRVALWRIWDSSRPPLAAVMLNPSKAGAVESDPTVTRQLTRAHQGGYGSLWVFNAHGYVETYPAEMKKRLKQGFDIVGPDTMAYLRLGLGMIRDAGGLVYVGWGVDGGIVGQDRTISALAAELGVQLHCLKVLPGGQPGHPLYLPYSAKFQPWSAP